MFTGMSLTCSRTWALLFSGFSYADPSFMLQESTSLADLIGTPFEELNLEPLDQETKLQVHRQHQALLGIGF